MNVFYFLILYQLHFFSNWFSFFFHLQLWLADSIKQYMLTDGYEESNIKPVTPLGVSILLFVGLFRLVFSDNLLNHEQEFPEILIFDVWRICSLQRKMRIDAASLCTMDRLSSVLVELKLLDTIDGQRAAETVIRILKSIDYGTRGLDDNSAVFVISGGGGVSVIDGIKAELDFLLPTHAKKIVESLSECLDVQSDAFTKNLSILANITQQVVSGGDDVNLDSPFSTAFIERIIKNVMSIRKIVVAMQRMHLSVSLGPLIDGEVAKLSGSQAH